MTRILAVIIGLLLLSGCTTLNANLQAAQTTGGLAGIAQFTQADLKAAAARATAGNDPAGAQCYTTLSAVIDQAKALVGSQGPGVAGPIDAFEAARILAKSGPNSADAVAQQVNLGCAALFVDAQATMLKLGVIGATKLP